jgi:hypothetical protein
VIDPDTLEEVWERTPAGEQTVAEIAAEAEADENRRLEQIDRVAELTDRPPR